MILNASGVPKDFFLPLFIKIVMKYPHVKKNKLSRHALQLLAAVHEHYVRTEQQGVVGVTFMGDLHDMSQDLRNQVTLKY